MNVDQVLLQYANINLLLNISETLLLIVLVAFHIWDKVKK